LNRKLFYIIIGLFLSIPTFAQTDTEFWFGAPAVTPGHENAPIVFRLTSYSSPATVTISEPANPSFVPIIVNLAANATITQDVTAYLNTIESKPSATALNYGIRITATANISAYYEVGHFYNPEIFPLKGNTAKGTNFIIPSQTQFDNRIGINPNANNGFVIVATEDNTSIDITLTNPDGNGHPVGKFTIVLNKGQTYAVIGSSTAAFLHLGGSEIKSTKAICVTIYDDSILVGGSLDLAGDQIVPVFNTGSEFIVVRGSFSAPSYSNTDFYFIWATVDGTSIYLNGSSVPVAIINKGQSYKGLINTNSVYITTSNPCYVLQFTGVGTEVTETSLPSIKCTGSSTVSFVRSTNELFYLNLICKADDVNNFTLNGVPGVITPSLFFDVPGATGWKAARISTSNLPNLNSLVPNDVATVVSNTTGLFHLGFLNGGPSSGARLGYFSNYSKVAMAPNLITSSCLGSDIQLAAKQLNSVIYSWTVPHNFSSNIYNPVIPKSTLLDSGYYYVQATIPGCGTSIDSVHITINPLPSINLAKSLDTVCIGSSKLINFQMTGKAPWNLVYWNGVKSDTLKNITNTSANFSVHPIVTTVYQIKNLIDSNACALDANALVYDTMKVNALPVANFSYSSIHCEKNSIVFTDQSKANLDTLSKWYWDMGNGVKQNLLSKTPFGQVYSNWGVDTVKLLVESSLGCRSDTIKKVITINPLPIVGFTIPNVCLDGGLASFNDTTKYKGSPTTFTYQWNFNAGNTPITPGPTYAAVQVSSKKPSVLYNTGGDYSVQLNVTTSDGCVDSLLKLFTINGSNPIANFTVIKNTALCSNEDVVIKDSSWVYPGRVGVMHILWGDGKDTTIMDSKIGNLYHHFYGNAVSSNNYNYNIQVQAFSGGTCNNNLTKSIEIVKPPTNVSLQATKNYLCVNDSLQIVQTINGGTPPFSYILNTDNLNASIKGNIIYGITPGNINVGLNIIDSKNCNYDYKNLLNLNLPVLPIASLSAKDTVICNGDSVTLKGQGASIYKWYKNGSLLGTYIVDSLKIGKAGNYSLIVNDGKCNSLPTSTIPIIEFIVPQYNFSYHNLSCTNGDVKITTNAVDKANIHFAWNFGDSSYFYKANPLAHNYSKIGKYLVSLKVTNDYCPKYNYALVGDSIQIITPLPPKNFTLFVLSAIDTLLSPKRVETGYTNYTWIPAFNLSNPNIPNPIFNGDRNIDYTLQLLDTLTGCKILDIYKLDVSTDVVVNVPKAFTPNHDNLNDYIKIEYGAGVKALKSFIIFNRFGKIVFQTNDITKGWDGRFNGYDQEMDGYSYLIDYITYKDIPMRKTGSFILMR
jgi:gliding motility-associated-like protein